MRDFLRNLRVPGRRPQGVRRRAVAGRPRPQTRQFSLGRAPRPERRREIHVPWRRIGIATASLATTCAVLYAALWLVTGDTFRVREINVVGAQVEDARAIAFASGLGRSSLLTLDTGGAEEAIGELPGVKSVTVSRAWPHGARIEIVEHQAWGYWQVANQVFEIDAEGRVLERARPAPEGAPTIIELAGPRDGSDADGVDTDTVQLVARMVEDGTFDDIGIEALGFVFRQDRGLTVLVDESPSAIFGDSSNYEFKVQAWRGLVREIRENGIEAQEIDLRFGRNVVLR
jgi:hypothetical protein